MPTKIIMPQLGESVVEGTISKWLKQEGDPVQEMDGLLEVNTDKVDSEIPSPASGVLLKILAPEGETIRAGTIIAWVGQPGEAIPGMPVQGGTQVPAENRAAQPVVNEPVMASSIPTPSGQSNGGNSQPAAPEPVSVPAPGRSRELGFISPIVSRLAQEHQVNLSQITGTGEGGRITKKDVLDFIAHPPEAVAPAAAAAPEPWETPGEGDLFRPTEMMFPQSKPAQAGAVKSAAQPAAARTPEPVMSGEGQVIPLSAIRRRIAEHMVTSERTAPHVTTVMEADLQRVLAHYHANKDSFARGGARLTYTAYFVAAAAQALRANPQINASWTEQGILIHQRINIGLAVSLGDEGLIVPVLKGADELALPGLARAIGDLAGRAREHKLQPEDVQDGTFTITNHGISGSLFATPIINQPQCAILGVGAVEKRVVVVEDAAGGDTIAIRPMVYLSLTFDHRVLDGASADAFLNHMVQTLEHWQP
ncbi:MAG TPA: dihydrolipoamide acetyltransferase family protein [Anaerolineaceae bacterium]